MITEYVDIHSLRESNDGWELTVFQTPEYLKIPAESLELFQRIQKAQKDSVSIKISWNTDSLIVLSAEF